MNLADQLGLDLKLKKLLHQTGKPPSTTKKSNIFEKLKLKTFTHFTDNSLNSY